MATFRDEQMRTRSGWSRTRWLVVAGVLVAIAVAVVLVVVYSGGGGSGGGGGY
jgi:predicted cobalt transporter CbtA